MRPARYLAVIASPEALAARAAAADIARTAGLEPAFSRDSLAVFTDPQTRSQPLGDNGLIVGSAFAAQTAPEITDHIIGSSCNDIAALPGAIWGDYVAFAHHRHDDAVNIVRSPSGGLHVYRTRKDQATYVASHADLLIGPCLTAGCIDWIFVAQHLAYPHLHAARTGIEDIDEIFAGDCATERGDRRERRAVWTPWSFTNAAPVTLTADEAADKVARAIHHAVSALVAPDESTLIELSGGLDSSIVAAALCAENRTAIAANLFTPGGEGDERTYARAVSARTGIPLIERSVSADIDLTEMPAVFNPRPGMLAMLRAADRCFLDIGREHDISAFINGTGGDCVFCALGTAAPATDRLLATGWNRGVLTTLADVAAVHSVSVWKVARLMLRQLRGQPRVWPHNTQFLNADLLPDTVPFHPWLDAPRRALPGSKAHVAAILASYAHLDAYGRHALAPSLFPLLSQPVVEACLSVPSWLWVTGGRDRAIARLAFRDDLPPEVAYRRTKGAMDAYCARIFDMNRDQLRPFLLDGLLAGAGLLDRSAIETYLAASFTNRDQSFYLLLPIIDAEAWARDVTDRFAPS